MKEFSSPRSVFLDSDDWSSPLTQLYGARVSAQHVNADANDAVTSCPRFDQMNVPRTLPILKSIPRCLKSLMAALAYLTFDKPFFPDLKFVRRA